MSTRYQEVAGLAVQQDGAEALGLLERSLAIVDSLGVGYDVGARLQELIDLLEEKLGPIGRPEDA